MITLRHKCSQLITRFKSALLILGALMTVGQVSASLSGTYTIDPSKSASSTNYVSFADAVDDLLNGSRSTGTTNGPGVSGAVTFNVAKGTYEEQIAITAISGASSTNTITFQSASGKSADVLMIDTSNSSTNNYLIYLDGATNTLFKNLTLSRNVKVAGSKFYQYTNVVVLQNNADYNQFIGNEIIGYSGSNYYPSQAVVYSYYNASYTFTNDQNNLFDNNHIKYGSYSIMFAGTYSQNDSGNVFTNNIIDSVYYGNYFYYEGGFTFKNNIVKNQTGTFSYGVLLYYGGNGINIENNTIDLENGGYGILTGYTTCDTTLPFSIANNMVTVKGANAYYGIYSYNNQYAEIVYNNIYHEASSSYYYGVYIGGYSTSDNYLFNNNIYESGTGIALYYQSGYLKDENNNNIYAPNATDLVNVSGTPYADITTYKAAVTPFGTADTSVNPRYAGVPDLHISNVVLNGAGKPWISNASVLKDIDGETRSTTKSDIGADEFFPPLTDGAIASIDSPSAGFCSGVKNIYVKLSNAGLGTITSAKIDWSLNGTAQTAISWTGTLLSGSETLVKLGSTTFSGLSATVIKADLTRTNTLSPDSNTANNSKTANVYVGMSGTYTIGGTSPSFANFTDAADTITNRGLCNSITFDVRDGAYNEQIILNDNGTSASKTITFQSVSKDPFACKFSYPSTTSNSKDYIVWLKGADWVTFKQIGFERPYSSQTQYGTAIVLNGGAHQNTIDGCQFRIPNQSYPNSAIQSLTDVDTSNTIKNNKIKGGYYAIALSGSYTLGEFGNSVINNEVDSYYYMGIISQYQRTVLIDKNKITGNQYPYGYGYGIYDYAGYDQTKITNNYINMPLGGYGILSYYMGGNSFSGGFTSLDTGLVANNQIYIGNNTTYSYGAAFGIYLSYPTGANVYHNSVLNESNNTSNNAAFASYSYSSSSFYNLVNNVLINRGAGYSLYLPSSTSLLTIDYNDYYASSGNLGYFAGTIATTLADIQTATSQDANSMSFDVLFASVPNNLKIKSSTLSGTGKYFGPALDVYGKLRSKTAPTPGANEIIPYANNASIVSIDSPANGFCAGTKNVYARLANYGSNNLTQATVRWALNSTTYTPYYFSYSTGLKKNQDTLIKLGSAFIGSTGTYKLTVWVDSTINGTVRDEDRSDDTLNRVLATSLNGVYTIGSASGRNFASVIDAVNALNTYGVCGKTTFNIDNGTYKGAVTFKSIVGVSSANTVTFNGNKSDSTKVILTDASSSFGSAVVNFDGAQYISLNNLYIYNTGSFAGNAVSFAGGSEHDSINSSQLRVAYQYAYPLYSSGSVDQFNTFNKVHFASGYYGVYFSSGFTFPYTYEVGNQWLNCKFDSAYYSGALLYFQDSFKVNHSVVDNIQYPYSGGNGLYLYYTKGKFEVNRNNIHLKNGGYGIYSYYLSGSTTDSAYITNNFISIEGPGTGYNSSGMYIYYMSNVNVFHNSINVTDPITNSYGLWTNYGTSGTNYVTNNIFSCASGIPMYIDGSVASSDYNNFYAITSGNVASLSGTTYTSLSAWQTATTFDINSFNIDPKFKSITDLHITARSLVAGTPLVSVPRDYDNQTRNKVRPTIGADEVLSLTNNAGVQTIDSPSLGFCAGNKNVYVRLGNFGKNSLTQATIRWSVNGTTYTPFYFSYSGGLTTNQDTLLKLGTVSISSGSTYTIKSWIDTTINGSVRDEDRSDDTAQATVASSLNGVFTIGKASGRNYKDVLDAVTALNAYGVCGPVLFKIDNGTYAGAVTIGKIIGASKVNSITFIGNKSDSTKVVITDASTAYGQGVLTFNGAKYVTFKDVFVWNTGTSAGNAVNFQGGSEYDSINSSQLRVTYQYAYPLFSQAGIDQYNIFDKVHFSSGYYGVYFSPGFTYPYNYELGNQWLNCNFDSSYYSGALLYFQDSFKVKHSVVDNIVYPYGGGVGLYLYYTKGQFEIDRNNIHLSNGGYGIYGYQFYGSTTDSAYVTNNFISVEGPGTGYLSAGMYLYYMSNVNVFHNSINVTDPITNSYGLWTNYGTSSTNYITNNIFSCDNGTPVYFDASIASSDHNDLYAVTSGNIGSLSGTTYSTLASWQTASTFDVNSLSADPKYKSVTDLHINSRRMVAGIGLVSVPKDYDLQLRSPLRPTIGADEILPLTNDAGIASIDSPAIGFCAGTKNVYVRLGNYGKNTLTQATIRWSVNGTTYTPFYFSYATGLKTNEDSLIKLGSLSISSGTTYVIKSWIDSTINKTVRDEDRTNDSSTLNVASSLNGTYTIGTATGRNYSDVVSAVSALNAYGICGPVVFNIDNGTYTGSVTIGRVLGSSSINTITFNGNKTDSTLVTLTDASSTYGQAVISFAGARYTTFNNVFVWNTGSSSGNAVNFSGGSHHNFINSSQLRVSYQYAYPLFSQQDVDEYNTFNKVHFSSGYYGVYFSSGFKYPYVYEKANIWTNCTFDSAYYSGALLYFQDSFQIKHSVIDNIQYPYGAGNGLYLYYTAGKFDVSRNNIHIGLGGYGIYGYSVNGSKTDSSYIANNFIVVEGPGTGYQSAGIYLYSFNNLNIYHNSINVTDNVTRAYGLYTYGSSGADNYILNNIFDCDNGMPMDIDGSITNSDYNDFHSATAGNVAALSGTGYTTLSDWQTASSFDANGLNLDPSFKSITDLHAKAGGLVAGIPISTITVDIDNQVRSKVRPVIGADEFTPLNEDAAFLAFVSPTKGGCGDSNVVISANITNSGVNTVSSTAVRYRAYKGATLVDSGTVTYTGTLTTGTSALVNFSLTKKLNTYAGGTYSIIVYTDYNKDLDRSNDTGTISIDYYPHFGNPTTTSITSCGGSSKSNVLRATAAKKGDNLVWTDLAGNFLTKGDSLVTTATKSTVYFVQAQSDTFFVGEDGNTISGTSSNTPTGSKFGLEFDALKDIVIDSVDVIASTSGNVTFTVYDGTTVIGKSTAAVSGSGSLERVPVKIKVPTGTAYQIIVSGTSIAAYYDYSGYAYSYLSRGVEITNGIYYGSTSNYSYTGLFNWQVSDTDACPSQKVPAALIIGTGGKPNASFTTSNNCSNDSLKITDNSTISTGSITGGVVSFGDGTFGKIATVGGSIYHKYPKSGSYKVTYAVSGSGGCVDDTTVVVAIAPAPRAYFYTSSQKCAGDSISFFDTSYSATTYTRTFDFNGVRVSSPTTTYKYAFSGSGPYIAKLIVVAKNGCTDSISKTFKLNAAPSLKINVDSATLCNPSAGINFTADTTNGYNSTYNWTYGDGTSNGTGQSVTHTYSKNGSYTLQLNAVSAAGCKSNALTTRLVYVQPLPVATFKVKLNGSKTFDFTANDTTVGNTYTWQYGDINSGSGKAVSHTYATTGKFIAELKVTNINNCSVNDTSSVFVVGIDANGNAPSNSLSIYPNPFLSKTNINYSIVERQKVTVDVIDITGRLVVRLVDATQNQGTFNVSFDREVYNALPGVYLVKITLGNKVITKEITSVR